jgi:hypothetical protein
VPRQRLHAGVHLLLVRARLLNRRSRRGVLSLHLGDLGGGSPFGFFCNPLRAQTRVHGAQSSVRFENMRRVGMSRPGRSGADLSFLGQVSGRFSVFWGRSGADFSFLGQVWGRFQFFGAGLGQISVFWGRSGADLSVLHALTRLKCRKR